MNEREIIEEFGMQQAALAGVPADDAARLRGGGRAARFSGAGSGAACGFRCGFRCGLALQPERLLDAMC